MVPNSNGLNNTNEDLISNKIHSNCEQTCKTAISSFFAFKCTPPLVLVLSALRLSCCKLFFFRLFIFHLYKADEIVDKISLTVWFFVSIPNLKC